MTDPARVAAELANGWITEDEAEWLLQDPRPACMTCQDRKILIGAGRWEFCPACIAANRLEVITEQR